MKTAEEILGQNMLSLSNEAMDLWGFTERQGMRKNILAAMEEYADQFRQTPIIEIEKFNHDDPAQTTEWVASWPLFPGMVVSAQTGEQAINELMTSIRVQLLYDFETKENA